MGAQCSSGGTQDLKTLQHNLMKGCVLNVVQIVFSITGEIKCMMLNVLGDDFLAAMKFNKELMLADALRSNENFSNMENKKFQF